MFISAVLTLQIPALTKGDLSRFRKSVELYNDTVKETVMNLKYYPYKLELKNTFTLSHSSRRTTDTVIVEIEQNGITGYGEACLPPYYPDTVKSVCEFLSKVQLPHVTASKNINTIIDNIYMSSKGDFAAKAACDIALHDLLGKITGLPLYKIWGIDTGCIRPTSYTLGIDTPDIIRKKALAASGYDVLKIKLGSKNDKALVSAIRDVTDQPLRVDINQGWTDKVMALDMIGWFKEHNTELVEQPMPINMADESIWLYENSPLPIIADESVCHVLDIEKIKDQFHGINIKLMKCGGLLEARRMITAAKSAGLKIMIGCMTESSCAISAAAQISALADWVDLDGALLVANDPFKGAELADGRIMPLDMPGIGVDTSGEYSYY
jgi:L-Ala-D/L-Glu epimerase